MEGLGQGQGQAAPPPLLKPGDRSKRDEWSEGGVLALLEVYESKWLLRNRAKLKGTDWDDIARQVSHRCTATKTPIQCKNKIESMKKRYRSEPPESSWQFYARMDTLLKRSPTPTDVDLPNVEPKPEPSLQDINQDVVLPTTVDVNADPDNEEGKMSKGTESDTSVPDAKVDDSEEREVPEENVERVKRRKGSGSEIAESVRLLADTMLKIEETRMEMYRESEKMRMEMEVKKGEMELKRTEIIAKTQLQIAKLFVKRFSGTENASDGSMSRSEVAVQQRRDAMGD